MKAIELTQDEVDQALYCLENMDSDYTDKSTQDYKDYSTLLQKLLEA